MLLCRRWTLNWWKCRKSCLCQSFQQQFVEQTVDIPVHGGVKRAWGDLQEHLPGQSSTALRRADFEVCPQGLVPGQGSTAPPGADLHVDPQGFPSGQGSTALRGADLHEHFQGLVPVQGSTALRGADSGLHGFVPGQSTLWRSSRWSPWEKFNSASWSSSSLSFVTQVDSHPCARLLHANADWGGVRATLSCWRT